MTSTTNISTSPRFFQSYQHAIYAGRLSTSQWRKRGRQVRPDAEPDYVVKATKRADLSGSPPSLRDMYTVVREVAPHLVEVLSDGWAVYSLDQTEPLVGSKGRGSRSALDAHSSPHRAHPCPLSDRSLDGKNGVNRTRNNTEYKQGTTPHHQHTLPYDADGIQENDESREWIRSCRDNSGVKKSSRQEDANNTEKMFVPSRFDWDKFPFLNDNRAQIGWIFHLLYVRRFTTYEDHDLRFGPDDFIPLKMEYLKTDIPDAQHLMALLLDAHILERDYYERGVKSYGYRFVDPELRHAKHRLMPIEDSGMSNRIKRKRLEFVKYPVLKWVRQNLQRVAVFDVEDGLLSHLASKAFFENGRGTVDGRVRTYRDALDAIRQGYMFFAVDFAKQGRKEGFGSRRVFHNLSNLKRELRRFCSVDGQQPVEIDIKNSQLLFLAHRMREKGIECTEFLRCCEQDVYQHIADRGRWTRQAVKKAITQGALFAPNDSRHQRHPIKLKVDELFPSAAKYLRASAY